MILDTNPAPKPRPYVLKQVLYRPIKVLTNLWSPQDAAGSFGIM